MVPTLHDFLITCSLKSIIYEHNPAYVTKNRQLQTFGAAYFLSEKLLHLCGSVVDIYAVHRQNVIQSEHTALILASLHLAGQNVAAHL